MFGARKSASSFAHAIQPASHCSNTSLPPERILAVAPERAVDRKSTRLNSSHQIISYAVFCTKKNSAYTQAEILAKVGDGLLVQDVAGLHSGVNPVSGDFSTGAEGLRIRGGELGEPVREFTSA